MIDMASGYDPKFYTRGGRLNRYALACGYIERAESIDLYTPDFHSVTLDMAGSRIRVRTYQREANAHEEFLTNHLPEARRMYAAKIRELGLRGSY